MVKELSDLAKAIEIGVQANNNLQKSHVKTYSRTTASGATVQVKEHDDSRHPNIIGTPTERDNTAPAGVRNFTHNGKAYRQTGKTGTSMHDGRPVREFESHDGHRVWYDHSNNVHADSTEEADRHHKRGRYADTTEEDAAAAKAAKDRAAAKPPLEHHYDDNKPIHPSGNTSGGFHGAAEDVVYQHAKQSGNYEGQTKEHEAMHRKIWDEASKHIKRAVAGMHHDGTDIRNYLDSRNGRNLADQVHDEIAKRDNGPKDAEKDPVDPGTFHEHIGHAVDSMEKKWPDYIKKRMAEVKRDRSLFK